MNANQEQWRPVIGFEGMYEVSDQGRVKSLLRPTHNGIGRPIRGGVLAPALVSKRKYPSVSLYRAGKQSLHRVHRLVLEAFVGPCPIGMEALHNNDIANDNCLSNLRWGTKSENIRDAVQNGNHRNARKTHCKHNHEFTPENTRVDVDGKRQCLACDRDRAAAYREIVKDDPAKTADKRDYQRAWMRQKRAKEYASRCLVQTTTPVQ